MKALTKDKVTKVICRNTPHKPWVTALHCLSAKKEKKIISLLKRIIVLKLKTDIKM